MELTSTSNDVLTGLLDRDLHEGIGLGETLETFDQLGKISRALGLNGHTHDSGHGELHGHERISAFLSGESSGLENELIDTNQSASVTARDGLNGLGSTTHHNHNTLNVLNVDIILRSKLVVGTKDANLLTSSDGSGENTTESVETTLIGSGHHLRDVHNERSLGVASADSGGGDIVLRTSVQILNTVLLGLGG